MKLSQMFNVKVAEVVILGQPVTAACAQEIIRRTDLYFWFDHAFAHRFPAVVSDYHRAVDDALNYPSAHRLGLVRDLDPARAERVLRLWRRRWQAIDLKWITNNQVLHGRGFCHPDGSVGFAGEIEDYPTGPELLRDLRLLARAFPELSMDVAVWCSAGASMLGFPMEDALESPWPPELLARVAVPTVGFLVGGGEVTTLRGFDARLFARFGLRFPQAAELALSEARRTDGLATQASAFGLRNWRGLQDAVVNGWIAKARALGLTR
jgi:hypothetical protein